MEHLIEDHDWFARRSLSSSDTEDVEILRSQGIPSGVEGITALAQALHIVPDTEDDRTEQTQSLLGIYMTPDHCSVTSQIAKQAKEKLSLFTLDTCLVTKESKSTNMDSTIEAAHLIRRSTPPQYVRFPSSSET